jgi:hypothetical protein
MLLQLKYTRKNDPNQFATVIGDPDAVRDLYWQLTHNYNAQDGTAIGIVSVFDMIGNDVTSSVMQNPHAVARLLTRLF